MLRKASIVSKCLKRIRISEAIYEHLEGKAHNWIVITPQNNKNQIYSL